jgi:hypothetical protein
VPRRAGGRGHLTRAVDTGQGDVSWHILADPQGNEFCLLRSRVEPQGAERLMGAPADR